VRGMKASVSLNLVVTGIMICSLSGCGDSNVREQNVAAPVARKLLPGEVAHELRVGIEIGLDADGKPSFEKLKFVERDGAEAESEFHPR